MDNRFLAHNSHLENGKRFGTLDPQLHQLKKQHYVYSPLLLEQLPTNTPGIYTLGGDRQIGKTTLLKQWMAKLIAEGTPPQSIVFSSGELL